MNNIFINYGDLVNELRNKKVRTVGQKLYKVWGQFIIDEEGNMYKMIESNPYERSYEDELIESKVISEFEKVDSEIIPEWNRIIYSLEFTEEFVKILDKKEYRKKWLLQNN